MGCKGSQVQILSPRPTFLAADAASHFGLTTRGPDRTRATTDARVFLEQYKLEANPFVAEAARPVFASHSMRYAALKLDEFLNKHIQSLFLSGPPGVGKSTLTRQRMRQLKELSMAWI